MVRLALPGLIVVEAECLAFEVLTLTTCITWQIPFPLSIAISTRITKYQPNRRHAVRPGQDKRARGCRPVQLRDTVQLARLHPGLIHVRSGGD
jgi:hypothetical protein